MWDFLGSPRWLLAALIASGLSACASLTVPAPAPTPMTPIATHSPIPIPSATASVTATITPTATSTLHPLLISGTAAAGQINAQVEFTPPGGRASAVALSARGELLAVGDQSGLITLYDLATASLLRSFDHHRARVYALAFSPDDSLLVSGSRDRTVQSWDVQSGERLGGSRAPGEVLAISVTAGGEQFAGVGYYSAIGELWNTRGAESLGSIEGHPTRLRSVAYSADGRWLATSDEEGRVLLRRAEDLSVVLELDSGPGEALSLAFSRDGERLAVGSEDGRITLWDSLSGLRLVRWHAHGGEIWALAFSPDGRTLISGGGDGLLGFWDATSGERFKLLRAHTGDLRSLAVSRDGGSIATAGEDGRAILWALGE